MTRMTLVENIKILALSIFIIIGFILTLPSNCHNINCSILLK